MTQLLTPETVAEQLAVSPKTLSNWRAKSHGPGFVKVGALVRYRQEDVDAYVASLVPISNVVPLTRRRA